MSRGGYRPGAGRKKGSKSKGKIFDSDESARIKEMLSHGLKAKAKIYSDYLGRVRAGEKVSVTEKRLMDKIEAELTAEVSGITGGKSEGLLPLEYMLKIMNDPNEDKELRARMATAAAPYLHARKGEDGTGKKDEKAERAKEAGKGKFAAGRSPITRIK